MYLRYFDKKKDILLNATAKKDLLTITKKIYFAFLSLILVIFGKQKEDARNLFPYFQSIAPKREANHFDF